MQLSFFVIFKPVFKHQLFFFLKTKIVVLIVAIAVKDNNRKCIANRGGKKDTLTHAIHNIHKNTLSYMLHTLKHTI